MSQHLKGDASDFDLKSAASEVATSIEKGALDEEVG